MTTNVDISTSNDEYVIVRVNGDTKFSGTAGTSTGNPGGGNTGGNTGGPGGSTGGTGGPQPGDQPWKHDKLKFTLAAGERKSFAYTVPADAPTGPGKVNAFNEVNPLGMVIGVNGSERLRLENMSNVNPVANFAVGQPSDGFGAVNAGDHIVVELHNEGDREAAIVYELVPPGLA